MNLTHLAHLQQRWATQVIIPPVGGGYLPQSQDIIFSLDIQYVENIAFVALDVQRYCGERLGIYVGKTPVVMEYIPHFFCFREGPPLLSVINEVRQKYHIIPQLLITDGHGIAHPRRFGVACWLGIQTLLPVIGCAKQSLLDYQGNLAHKRGSLLSIWRKEEEVGKVLRTQDGIKPIFVSPGYQIDLTTATEIILTLTPKYRQPEPLRRADHAARIYAKGQTLSNVIFIQL
jgi:deoxyribonuclease V